MWVVHVYCRYCSKYNDCKGVFRQEQTKWPVCSCAICWSCTQFYARSSNPKGWLIIVFPSFFEYCIGQCNVYIRELIDFTCLTWRHHWCKSADVQCVWQICGIGKVSEKMLFALGIVTCSQLYEQRDILYHLYSPSSFEHFMQITLGIGSTRVERFVLFWLLLSRHCYICRHCHDFSSWLVFFIPKLSISHHQILQW